MRRCLLILSALTLAGCAHFESKPIEPEKSAARLEARRLNDPGLQKFLKQNLGHEMNAASGTNWNLPELTLTAFYFHPALEVARAQWLVATAGLKTAGARPNPSVTVTPAYDSQIPGNYSPWLVPVSFDVPVETAGKRGKRLAEAEKISESARWNYVSAAWQIRSGVRTALVDFIVAGKRVELLRQQFATQTEIVKRLQGRYDAGEISRSELTTAQIALTRAQLDLSDARLKQSDARSQLAQALGLSAAALEGQNFNHDFSTSGLAQLTATKARELALRSRADILAALADYSAAEADLQLEVAKQYPDLHFGPGYAWNSGNAGDNEWSLGLTLELPILDQNQGPIAEAEARRKLAAAKFVELQSQVIAGIDRAAAGWRVAEEQCQTANELLAAEQQQQASTEAQIDAGAGDQLDLLNAQLESSSAALAQLAAEAQRQTAYGALEDALQQPVDSIAATIQALSPEHPKAKSSHP